MEKQTYDKLVTPCGCIRVYRNGMVIPFVISESSYNIWWVEDENTHGEREVKPDAAIDIGIDLREMNTGDTVVCAIDNNCLTPDGGDENMINSTGTNFGYAIGMGTTDTDNYEMYFDKKAHIKDIHNTDRYLCYTSEHCEGGFIFEILDNPQLYRDIRIRKQIDVIVVWCNLDKDYAEEMVYCMSS